MFWWHPNLQLTRQFLCPQPEEQRPELLRGTATACHISNVLSTNSFLEADSFSSMVIHRQIFTQLPNLVVTVSHRLSIPSWPPAAMTRTSFGRSSMALRYTSTRIITKSRSQSKVLAPTAAERDNGPSATALSGRS